MKTEDTTRGALGFTRDKLAALSAHHREPDWMLRRRLDSFEAWLAAPLPSPELEDWRRTDLRHIDFAALSELAAPNGGGDGRAEPADAGGYLQFVDGGVTVRRLADEYARQGVVLCSLHEALAQCPELVERSFMSAGELEEADVFARLHGAFWTSGTFVYVPPGVQVDQTLAAAVRLSHGGVSALHHTLVVVDQDARLRFVEELSGVDGGDRDPALSAPVLEVYAGPGAQVEVAGVQAWGKGVVELASRRAVLDRGSRVVLTVVALGGALNKDFVTAAMVGEGANCELHGITFAERGQHFDTTTLQDHRAPNCRSNLLFKGALYERARSVFRGVVRVHPEAQKTDAYQTNNNLLLGDDARADSMPVLEIEADDVRCSHGATLAHLSEEDLFYLRSRGLDRDTAQRMVIAGFFEPVIDAVPLASTRERLKTAVSTRISQH